MSEGGCPLEISYTTTATLESRMYDGMRLLNRSCPAVSQSCSRTVLSSRYIVYARHIRTLRGDSEVSGQPALERKSMPMVAWYMLSKESYMKRVMSDVFPTAHTVRNFEGHHREAKRDPYRFVRRGRPACSCQYATASPRPESRLPLGPYLNFFSGALYDPPACAIVER